MSRNGREVFRRLAHTFRGPKVNYFPHLSKRQEPNNSQNRGPGQGGKGLQGFRNSLSEPEYKYEYRPHASPASPRVMPAEGASPFATPDYDPVRNSLKDPEYSKTRPATSRKL